jgi:ubiquitin C-terminal hydrolase
VRRVVSDGLPGAAKARRYAPRGMANTTNLCYFNAACQALLPCAPFAMLMSNAGGDTVAPVHAEMYRLLKQFYASRSTAAVDPAVHCKELLAAWGKARVERGQEDAGEFLMWIFDALHEECKWRPPGGLAGEEESPLTRCFGGRVKSTVTKIHDPSTVVETRFESFRVLPLPLGPDATSVAGAVQAYVQQCAAEGSDMHVQVHFDVLPPTLVLALNRTLFNVETGRAEKDKRSIQLDEILRIGGEWQSSELQGASKPPVEYRLTAVICHYGEETSSGHYNALAQQHDGQWYMYDDLSVRAVPAAELQASAQTSAHVLVYQRPDCTVNVRPV